MEIFEILVDWEMPESPQELKDIVAPDEGVALEELGEWLKALLGSQRDVLTRASLELATLDWLYDLITLNVRRGGVFEVQEALLSGRADCLGYTRIFEILGPRFGLELGVVEVVIDNAGRYVPHQVVLCLLATGEKRFVDPWYGSKDIHHRRVGALVKREGRWRVEDVDEAGLQDVEVRGLPPECLDAITCYIRGNRHLVRGIEQGDEGELDRAIDCYSQGIHLYPSNARLYFNRAVAYEREGEAARAELDYREALKDEASRIRVLANIEELERLIELDERGISPRDQQVYLLHRGYITGSEVSTEEVARRRGISEAEVLEILSRIGLD